MPSAPGWRRVLVVFLVGKAIAVGALLAGLKYYFTPQHDWNYVAFRPEQAGTLLAFINWDGQHYLKLAMWDYPHPIDTTAIFFPLFPALIWLASQIAGLHAIYAGIAVATLFSFLALLLLARLLPAEERGPSSLWLLACFPSAFYLSVVYTEGLFLTAFFGLLWALRDARRAPWALLFAAALPLSRAQGLWLAAPLALAWVAPALGRGGPSIPASLRAAALGYALGAAGYFAIIWANYGNPLAGLQMAPLLGGGHSLANLFDLPHFVDLLLSPPRRFLDNQRSGLDKLMMLLSLFALLYGLARGARDPFLSAAWACFAVLPAMSGEGSGYARYALLAWGCFAVSAGPTLGAAAKWALIAPCFALQAWLAYHYGANRWVA